MLQKKSNLLNRAVLYKQKLIRAKDLRNDRNKLFRLINSAKEQHVACQKKIKILFAPGFNIGRTFINHDVIVASLLHSKGARIHYTYGMERLTHPIYFGGVWRANSAESEFRKSLKGDEQALQYFVEFAETSDMADFVAPIEVREFKEMVAKLSFMDLKEFSYNGIQLGHDAMNRVRNMHMVSDISLIDKYEALLKKSIINCMVYFTFFKRVIKAVKPDRIFSHESFYYPWSIMQKMADRYDIPFYNYYCAVRKNAYIYANNEPAMLLNMETIWSKVKNESLSAEKKRKVLDLIKDRKLGNTGRLKQARIYDKKEKNAIIGFANSHPTAVLYGNVVWDLTALDKEIIFPSIQTAYIRTVRFFIEHPEFKLIIKPHPDETNSRIPTTVEQLSHIIKDQIGNLPDNILLLSNESAITAYDLFRISSCSLVYSTTTGIESAIEGTPTVTLGNVHYRNKGFTYDPRDEDEYYQVLTNLLRESTDPGNRADCSEQAIKYFYYYYYELFTDYGIPSNSFYNNVSRLSKKSPTEFLSNHRLECAIDTIMEGERI